MKSVPIAKKTNTPSGMRQLPAIETLLESTFLSSAIARYSRPLVTEAARHTLAALRHDIRRNQPIPTLSMDFIAQMIIQHLSEEWAGFAQPVINATGIILHTNLGRAPLSDPALKALNAIGGRYLSLESNLSEGTRGVRTLELRRLLSVACHAEDALAVNNNAAAMLLVLIALAGGKEALISRGELVQIGNGFRIPEILEQSGVILREVGTTNQTSARDYEKCISERTGLIVKVHQSNFVQKGFVSSPSIEELAAIAGKGQLPLVYDMGNGALLDTAHFGLEHEPTVMESLRAGADVVCFSGDKLLGGPQAGIIAGKREFIRLMLNHPLLRVIRLDKLSAIALATTIKSYLDKNAALELPLWQMIRLKKEEIRSRASTIAQQLKTQNIAATIQDGVSLVGGGTLPEQELPTTLICLSPPRAVDKIARRLRLSSPPLVARVEKDAVLIDLRTVFPDQDALLPGIIAAAWAQKD